MIQLLRRAGLAVDTGDPAQTFKRLKGRMYSIYHRLARNPTEEAMRRAIIDLEDVASLALMRVETMPEEWLDAEPDDWWNLGWLRHCAVTAISALETAIASLQALKGRGPLTKVYSPEDLRLPRVRQRLHASVRAAMRVLRSLLLHQEEEYEDEESRDAARWAQTLLVRAGTATAVSEGGEP